MGIEVAMKFFFPLFWRGGELFPADYWSGMNFQEAFSRRMEIEDKKGGK